MASCNKAEKARARSRSRTGRCGGGGSHGSSRKKTAKDSLPSDVPEQCSHHPPPPYRPAGPFALYFAANHASVQAKEVSSQTDNNLTSMHAFVLLIFGR